MREMKDSGVEWVGEIPADWDVLRNKNTFTCRKKLVGAESSTIQLLSLTTKGIRKKDVNNAEGKLPESFDTYQYVQVDELVMCLFDLDCSAVFSGISPYFGMISPAYKVLSCLKNMVPRYAEYWFKYVSDGRKFNHYAKNIRYTLSYEEFSSLPILVPHIDIQKKIVSFLDSKCSKIDDIIARGQAAIEKLKEYKLSVITEAVTKGLNPEASMKDSGYEFIGKIPATWRVLQLRYVGKCQNGISKSGEFFGTGFPFVSYSDVYKNYELPVTTSGLIESSGSERKSYSVQKGDVFFTRTSETIEEVGLTAVCLKSIEKATFAGFLIRVRPNKDIINPLFSKYYFRSEHHRQFIVKEMNLVTRASLGQELLKRLPVLLPPLHEQQEISTYLENKCVAIDQSISKKQLVIDKLTEYKKSLIYEVVTGKKEV